MNKLNIRWMIRRDTPLVLRIEVLSFTFVWTEEDFLRCLSQRNCVGMVAEQGEKLLGFMVYELHKTKLHLLNFAVHPDYRHQKIGRAMVDKLISKLSDHRRPSMSLTVRETNLQAQLFFQKMGFKAISVCRNFYDGDKDTGEAGYLMEYSLASASK